MGKKGCCLLAAGLLTVLTACSILPKEEVFPTAPVIHNTGQGNYTLVEVRRGDLTDTAFITCTYRAGQQADCRFALGGVKVAGIYVEEGQYVKKGELLAELDSESTQQDIAGMQEQKKQLQQENKQLEAQQKLKKEKEEVLQEAAAADESYRPALIETQAQLRELAQRMEEIRGQLQVCEKRLAELQQSWEKTRVTSPVDGYVTYVMSYYKENLVSGLLVSEDNKPVCTVSDYDGAYFEARVEGELFSVGQTVPVTMAGRSYDTTVTSCEADEYGKYEVQFELTHPDTKMKPGRTGMIEWVKAEYKDVLYLPAAAVHEQQGICFVYYLDESGARQEKEVTAEQLTAEYWRIVDGLAEGDQVVAG